MANPNIPATDAERVQAFLDAYRDDDDSELVDQVRAYVYLTIGDLRGVLADRDRLAARVAELEQRQAAPVAAESGECDDCGCCSRAGCHRRADATCPTNSLGDSVCPCTEE